MKDVTLGGIGTQNIQKVKTNKMQLNNLSDLLTMILAHSLKNSPHVP